MHEFKTTSGLFILLILFGAVFLIQLIYLLLFIKAFASERRQGTAPLSPVSVVVCAHDEEQNLRELIPILLAQDYSDFEVIIVNDRSNDGTYDFLLEEIRKDGRLRTVTVTQLPANANGKKYGITLGIKAARYEIILLTDADCRPVSRNWIELISSSFDARAQIVIGYSGYFRQKGLLNLFIRYETLFTAMQYIAFALMGMPYMGVGRNLAYRKALFLENKGFDKNLGITGGDDDLFVNAHATSSNVRVCISPDSMVYSIPKTTWSGFLRQKVRHLAVGSKYKFKHRFRLGLFVLSMMFVWIFGMALLIKGIEPAWVILALGVRLIVLTIAVDKASKRVGEDFKSAYVLVLDFVFAFYYLTTGAVALVSKNLQWKKN